jgi:hypothetical protein
LETISERTDYKQRILRISRKPGHGDLCSQVWLALRKRLERLSNSFEHSGRARVTLRQFFQSEQGVVIGVGAAKTGLREANIWGTRLERAGFGFCLTEGVFFGLLEGNRFQPVAKPSGMLGFC